MKEIDKIIRNVKKKFPNFTDEFDSVRTAFETDEYVRDFPEDMVEGRTSWNELHDMLDRMRYGFNELLNLFSATDTADGGAE